MKAYLKESLYEKMYDCTVEKQTSATIMLKPIRYADLDLCFDEYSEGDYYIIYKWGQAPGWVRPLLNTDTR